MKTILAASAIALLATGSVSAADYGAMPTASSGPLFSGVAEAYGGFTRYTGGEGNANNVDMTDGLIGGAVRVNMPVWDRVSVQFDIDASHASYSVDRQQYKTSAVGTAHLNYRTDRFLVGVFGGGGHNSATLNDPSKLWFSGVEAQVYFNDFTLYGQAGWMDSVELDGSDSDTFHDARFVRGVGRYFFNPDTMLQGEVGYAWGQQDTVDYNMDALFWGVRAERAFEQVPITAFVAYEGAHYNNGPTNIGDRGTFTEHTAMVGLKVRFGTSSLLENDRRGATLDAPRFGRMVGAGDTID